MKGFKNSWKVENGAEIKRSVIPYHADGNNAFVTILQKYKTSPEWTYLEITIKRNKFELTIWMLFIGETCDVPRLFEHTVPEMNEIWNFH